MSEINLVPENIQKMRQREALLVSSKKYVIFLLFLSGIFFGASLAFNLINKKSVVRAKEDTGKLELSIKSLYPAQEKSLYLVSRLESIKNILAERNHYSKFVENLLGILPDGVEIYELNLTSPTKAEVTGEAYSYTNLSKLISNITEDSKSLNSVFSKVSLSQVSLKKETGRISFSVDVEIKSDLLKDSLK